MATAAETITSARWDLKDEEVVQYSDPMLLDFINRGLRPLCTTLAALNNDWVNESTTLTLADTDNYVALPSDFISELSVHISTAEVEKKTISWIRKTRIDSSAGQPAYFAIQGTSLMFEKVADADYSILLEYHKNTPSLTINADMPFNNEFNDIIRQFIVLMCKSRIEYTSQSKDKTDDQLRDLYVALSESDMQNFFYQALFAKTVARNHIPNLYRTDF